jgi:hypothetical protein
LVDKLVRGAGGNFLARHKAAGKYQGKFFSWPLDAPTPNSPPPMTATFFSLYTLKLASGLGEQNRNHFVAVSSAPLVGFVTFLISCCCNLAKWFFL